MVLYVAFYQVYELASKTRSTSENAYCATLIFMNTSLKLQELYNFVYTNRIKTDVVR